MMTKLKRFISASLKRDTTLKHVDFIENENERDFVNRHQFQITLSMQSHEFDVIVNLIDNWWTKNFTMTNDFKIDVEKAAWDSCVNLMINHLYKFFENCLKNREKAIIRIHFLIRRFFDNDCRKVSRVAARAST